ncbi:hypothetical protein F2P81_003432 [Scophthalmus maximus]|uniref:Connector enhancer of kinase suppressor of ras 1 n=1 Tax=Scophthalmus maximus TaxID=52904 RepID=A0A6A4TM33_SCOMX|nr:hypothetical protein F2P81_003432 [Scophthalmus maximus]
MGVLSSKSSVSRLESVSLVFGLGETTGPSTLSLLNTTSEIKFSTNKHTLTHHHGHESSHREVQELYKSIRGDSYLYLCGGVPLVIVRLRISVDLSFLLQRGVVEVGQEGWKLDERLQQDSEHGAYNVLERGASRRVAARLLYNDVFIYRPEVNTYGMGGENLRGLTEKLRAVAHTLQMGIQSRWRRNSYDGRSATKLPAGVLQVVVELVTSAKGLFFLLNRYQFLQLSGYTATKNIFGYCRELGAIVHKCRQLVVVCDQILNSSAEGLLTHTAQLESVDLVPVSPGDQLGIEITSTGSSNHYVTGTAAEPLNDVYVRILAGDEVIQVNNQIVVGWSRANLVKKLQENPSGVTLVLKKIPGSARRKDPVPQEEEEVRDERSEEEEEEEGEGDNPRHSIFERVAASVRSLSFRKAIHGPEGPQAPMGQEESELSFDKELEGSLTLTSDQNQQGGLSPLSASGMTTALSRRRVSCRELDRPDCDGWLWKKRKESSVFIAQKWQRFWFVLTGPSLYWYTSQQDEKAEGLVNISSYNIESAGEHKRKYVFKMCHQRFHNFFFAADNVSDMSKWINCLITTIQKHKKLSRGPDSEEECYSETESESETSPSPRRRNKKVQSHTLPRPKGTATRVMLSSPSTGGSKGAEGPPEDEMGQMLNNIKEGGVSLIGHEQPFTHDHFRKSFIRRNKNPVINEKAHTLRALQSTLKAKEAELQQINKILDDSSLTASRYRQWKEQNEELVQEIEKLTTLKASKGGDDAPVQDVPAAAEVALETVSTETAAAETEGAYRLSLSEGEQLVDAEPSDVLLEIPPGSPSTDTSSELELSLGSLQDSINQQLSELVESGEAAENYFYI